MAKKISNPQQGTELLNIIGLVALAIPIFQIAVFQIGAAVPLWNVQSNLSSSLFLMSMANFHVIL